MALSRVPAYLRFIFRSGTGLGSGDLASRTGGTGVEGIQIFDCRSLFLGAASNREGAVRCYDVVGFPRSMDIDYWYGQGRCSAVVCARRKLLRNKSRRLICCKLVDPGTRRISLSLGRFTWFILPNPGVGFGRLLVTFYLARIEPHVLHDQAAGFYAKTMTSLAVSVFPPVGPAVSLLVFSSPTTRPELFEHGRDRC